MARLTREQIENSLLENVEKATKSNYSKEYRQTTYLMQLLDTIEFETMNVMQTQEGHINVGTLIECILKCMYNGEQNPSYSSKKLKDITLETIDENGKKHTKSYEVKAVLRNESSEVSANRLDLLIVSYNGINLLTRKRYNEIKNDLSIFKKDTHRLNQNVLKYCVEFQ